MALGVGAIIGTGLFVLTGVGAAHYAGPGIVFSFVLAGLVSALAALIYAELAAMVPAAGSAYTYAYAGLGEFIAWIIGWDLILEYTVAAGAVAIGWSGYLVDSLAAAGLALPHALTAPPAAGGVFNLPAAALALAVTGVVILGSRQSATASRIVVAAKLAAVVLFLLVGWRHVNPANWSPFAPFGGTGILAGAAIVFFAYIGFDAVATAAEETRRPGRDLPVGIFGALAISATMYVAVSLVLTGMVPFYQLGTASPVTAALLAVGERWSVALVSTGAVAGLASVILTAIYAQSRVFFAMARDGLLPPAFARLHPRYRTPHVTALATGVTVALIGGLLPIQAVAELANIGTLAAFVIVAIGVTVLRYQKPALQRPFRAPGLPWVPLGVVVASVYLAMHLPATTWIRFGLWLLLGLGIYFGYSRRHSHLQPRR